MATVKGIWTFKDVLNQPFPYLDEYVNFTASVWEQNQQCQGIRSGYCAGLPFPTLVYYDEINEIEMDVYIFEEYQEWGAEVGWEYKSAKTIDFGETEQEVSNEFYAWLTKNAFAEKVEINITENGTTTLATAGKCCYRNIDVNVNVPVGDSHYDAFWDTFQRNGERKDYRYGFSGIGWNDENFKPKYDIISNTWSAEIDKDYKHRGRKGNK